jgi:uncharacterized membrane protein YcaP (DUF421 family)
MKRKPVGTVRCRVLARCAEIVSEVLGLDLGARDLSFAQMAARALVVFLFGIALARLGDRRLLAKNAGYDIVLLVMLGSVLSRAINGQAPFFPTLGVSVLLVILHRLLGMAAFHSHRVSLLVKGRETTLIRQGRVDSDALRRNHITQDDLMENLRVNGGVADVRDVAVAQLERNGTISVVTDGNAKAS